jgi:hypothetical protein
MKFAAKGESAVAHAGTKELVMRKLQLFVRLGSIVLGTFLSVAAAQAQNPPPQPPGARLRGWVDLHTHPLSNLGFGGKLIYGGVDIGALLAADPDCNQNVRASSIQQALGHDKSTHGGHDFFSNGCGDEIRKLIITQAFNHAREDELGYPDFSDWPLWDDVTHQKMWVDWIRRAYNSGLRVMVALAVNNKTLGDALAPSPFVLGSKGVGDYPTDDRTTTDQQINETKQFVDRHSDFMEIAYSAADLERIVRANKLAVVLGVEIDNIGNLKGSPSTAQAIAEIDHLYFEGVTYVFPIHLLDNPFGGTATYDADPTSHDVGLFNLSTYREEGHYWDLGCAPPPMPGNPSSEAINYKFPFLDPAHLATPLLTLSLPKLGTVFPPLPLYPQNCGLTNNRGLTSLGQFAVEYMMQRGMFIDIDHMSDNTKKITITIALGTGRNGVIGYPLNSGHSGLRGFFPPVIAAQGHTQPPDHMNIDERSTSWWQYQQIGKLHGMVGVGNASRMAYQWANLYWHVLAATGTPMGSGIAGFGTDLNGMEKGSPPDVEQDAQFPNPQYTACMDQFQCDRNAEPPAGGVRSRASGAATSTALCLARAKATCSKQFQPTVTQCTLNCGVSPVQYSAAFPMSSLGTRNFNYNALGVAHYGMLADFLQDVKNQDEVASRHEAVSHQTPSRLVEDNLMYGADYFLQTWKKCEALKNPALSQRNLTDRQFTVTATPASVPVNIPTTIVLQVTDNDTRMPVANAMVHLGNQLFPASRPFQHVFRCSAPQPSPKATRNVVTEPRDFPNPSFVVSAPGFEDGTVEFTVSGVPAGKVACH